MPLQAEVVLRVEGDNFSKAGGSQGPGNFLRGVAALVQRHIGPPPRALLQPEHRQDRTRDFRRSIIGRPVDQGVIVFGDAEGSAPPSLVSVPC